MQNHGFPAHPEKNVPTMLFPDTTAFQRGPLDIKWYGLFIMAEGIVAALLAYRIARVKGKEREHISEGGHAHNRI